MSTQANTTVRYLNRKWVIDPETKTLHPEDDKKTRVDIDEVWDMLSDRDTNTIAFILSAKTNEEIEELEENEFED